jgi:hypothetical protein
MMGSGMMGSGMMGSGMMGSGMMGSGPAMAGGEPGMMPGMREGGRGAHPWTAPEGLMPFEHVEGWLAFLKAEVGLKDAQAAGWEAFADGFRKSAAAHKAVHEGHEERGRAATWPDRLRAEEDALSKRIEAVRALEQGLAKLYPALDDAQKTRLEALVARPERRP